MRLPCLPTLASLALVSSAFGCGPAPTAEGPAVSASTKPAPAPDKYSRLDRVLFNQMAVRQNQPVYWTKDADGDGNIDPGEVASLLFYPTKGEWVKGGAFTEAFDKMYEELVTAHTSPQLVGRDGERLKKVRAELDGLAVSVVATRTADWADTDKTFYNHMLRVAGLVDQLYEVQTGAAKVAPKVAPDPSSQSLFRRNRGPFCLTPALAGDRTCTAAPRVASMPVDVWPPSLQLDGTFCQTKIGAAPDAKELMKPFVAVREENGALVAKGYDVVYGLAMKNIAAELRVAVALMTDPAERPLVQYLEAAAAAFESNQWEAADEAWVKMNGRNSKWYLRIAPDETYWDPCDTKAGFHLSLGRIDATGEKLTDALRTHGQAMEDDVAKLIGPPYKARKVALKLPDVVDVVFNAGDSRFGISAHSGQVLPNWGPIKTENRRRLVFMANLQRDEDSLALRRGKAAALLSAAAMKDHSDGEDLSMLGPLLREATESLGPSSKDKVAGKAPSDVFGADLAEVLETLYAQVGAYYYLDLLQQKGMLTEADVRRMQLENVALAFTNASRGGWTAGTKRKPHGQAAAVQLGFFLAKGALVWDPDAAPADGGKEKGAFTIDHAKMKTAAAELMKAVGTIRARGDKNGALALVDPHVEEATSKVPLAQIVERLAGFAPPTYVYSVGP